ncbi:MAG: GNAT family N-acetyltransferase [Defluviitaleaceae bacterium]|nr:GNAT family N-acetyltransferase [Defluviitaleaceae bacterium]MCL2275217.1 GNAT family N-acetyltransferase [Defluviitaleaceae bacterium]
MKIEYRTASSCDIDVLVNYRLKLLKIEKTDENYVIYKNNIYNYFLNGFEHDKCDVILAYTNNFIVGTGLVYYFDSVPSLYNLSGKNGYITSMFVDEKYRRNGIASIILEKLMELAKSKHCEAVHLYTSSEEAHSIYKKYGFNDSKGNMTIKL